ncbi:MAG: hypothetical protein WBF04_08425 [Candidatus Sulfotelmatobacter sp.]
MKKILTDDGVLAEAGEEPQAFVERESFNRLVAEGEHMMKAEIAVFRAGLCCSLNDLRDSGWPPKSLKSR